MVLLLDDLGQQQRNHARCVSQRLEDVVSAAAGRPKKTAKNVDGRRTGGASKRGRAAMAR